MCALCQSPKTAAVKRYLMRLICLTASLMIVRPILRSTPLLVKGMPVFLEIFPFSALIPNNRFHENENPYFLTIWLFPLAMISADAVLLVVLIIAKNIPVCKNGDKAQNCIAKKTQD